MTQQLVSIVIPAYNREALIQDAIQSALGQSYRPIEIIVVDDGSSDATLEKANQTAKLSGNDSSVSWQIEKQVNSGANAARNLGIKLAKGSYIAFLDSDDTWETDKLQKQIAVLQNKPDLGGCYCGQISIDLDTGKIAKSLPKAYPSGDIANKMLIHDVTEPTSTWVLRSDVIKKTGLFDEALPARQDWDMWLRVSLAFPIGVVPEILVKMGEHLGERVRSDPSREIKAHKVIFDKYSAEREKRGFSVSLQARSAMYRRRGRVLFHRKQLFWQPLRLYLVSILCWPFAFDSYAALLGLFLGARSRSQLRLIWNRVFGKTFLAIKTH